MGRDPLGERWPEVYREAPEVFERFGDAEDRDGLIPGLLAECSTLGGARVLEIGCGTGRWTPTLAGLAGRTLALEPEPGMLAIAARRGAPGVHWVRARAQALPLPAHSFEQVFAGFVFANLRPRVLDAALAEVRRVLRPGGRLWVLENAGEDEFEDLRRRAGLPASVETLALSTRHGFERVASRSTRMEFGSPRQAHEVLGTLLGPRVAECLRRDPLLRLEHRIALLRW